MTARSNLDWNNPKAISILSLFEQLSRHSPPKGRPARSKRLNKAGSYKQARAKKGRPRPSACTSMTLHLARGMVLCRKRDISWDSLLIRLAPIRIAMAGTVVRDCPRYSLGSSCRNRVS